MFCVNKHHSFIYYTHTEACMTLVFSVSAISLYEHTNFICRTALRVDFLSISPFYLVKLSPYHRPCLHLVKRGVLVDQIISR